MSCVARTKRCKTDLAPAAKAAADSLAARDPGGDRRATPAPAAASAPAPRQTQRPAVLQGALQADSLKAQRDAIAEVYGADRVRAAESSISRIVADSKAYIRVPDSAVVDQIVKSGRFKTSAETKGKGNSYQQMRDQIEDLAFADTKGKKAGERPIYGYLASDDVTSRSHAGTGGYGNVIFQLKDSAKARATVSGDDSFRGQTPSAVDQPNIASFTRNVDGSTLNNISNQRLAQMKGDDIERLMDVAANARNIDDLVGNSQAPYLEAQIHGQLKTTDIGRAIFTNGQQPSDTFRKWAAKNNVEIDIR